MSKELSKTYDPKIVEERLYNTWQEKKYFHTKIDKRKKPFTIVMPPPNITGQLHMGHALDNTLQDILIRYKRMQGYSALWIPGTDHASIATEAKIVEAMKKEGLTKESVGRDGFLKRAWEWKEQYGGRIVSQLKKIGSSCDWDRERFTMDEGCSEAVKEVFLKLYDKGLIYRGERIINWCPYCKTSISDAEVEYEEQAGHFWHLRYPLSDGSGFIELATTRPETLLGDTAVAVNPDDERYKSYVGKTVILPLVNREIPIVADSYVDPEFGTGVVKITPAHDPNDFEVGLRHKLSVINVLTEDAHITDDYPKYAGMDRYDARKAIVDDLKEGGFLIKTEEHVHNVGTCYRCSSTVEPRVSKQWFVKMKPLAEPAIKAVKTGETNFVPKHFEKTYFHWLENIRDWCISRQLWWGHRIPAFYCDCCGETVVTKENSAVCPKCGKAMRQDPDTLDTWFSSALWPFSTLGWPEKTEDLEYFYPTNVLVTGYDIIPFWVMRMMFSAIEQTGEVPFDTVLIHGLVRDSQGRKMSKSLGNGIDPLEIIDKYGADALRFTLVTGNAPGNDMRFYYERVEASRNFANKIWNAARFILMNVTVKNVSLNGLTLKPEDKWILSKYNTLVKEVTENIDKYELGIAVAKLYDFIWNVYCDWYIEMVKPRLIADKDETAQNVLIYVMSGFLKLLHPFMPFITEEIYLALPGSGESIMISDFPVYDEKLSDISTQEKTDNLIELITKVRNVRSEMDVPPKHKTKLYVTTKDMAFLESCKDFLVKLTYSDELIFVTDKESVKEGFVPVISNDTELFLPLSELIDKDKETARLKKEIEFLEKELKLVRSKLGNKGFVDKAPAALVEKEKEKEKDFSEKLSKTQKSLAELI